LRVIFMGTDKFAVSPLRAIINSNIDLLCIITQPDRPRGRGLKDVPPPLKELALIKGLAVFQPEKVRDKGFVQEVLKKMEPDLIIIAAYGQILPKSILDLPRIGCINLHPSLLPKYRGAAPIQRAIINGEKETGVTVMFMDEGEDTGDIILQENMPIEIVDTSETLSQKLSDFAAQLILKTLELAKKDKLPRQHQDHTKATHAQKLTKEEGLIAWEKTAFEIHNLIRGTIPWPGAYTSFNENIQLKIWESLPIEYTKSQLAPGNIVGIQEKGVVVNTGDGSLLIKVVQPANKSKMSARDFANGYRLKIGDRFQ